MDKKENKVFIQKKSSHHFQNKQKNKDLKSGPDSLNNKTNHNIVSTRSPLSHAVAESKTSFPSSSLPIQLWPKLPSSESSNFCHIQSNTSVKKFQTECSYGGKSVHVECALLSSNNDDDFTCHAANKGFHQSTQKCGGINVVPEESRQGNLSECVNDFLQNHTENIKPTSSVDLQNGEKFHKSELANFKGNKFEMQKVIKLQRKEEKRRKREEDIRRKRIAPKDQHVKIIHHSLKDRLTAAATEDNPKHAKNQTEISSENFELYQLLTEFPDLTSSNLARQKNHSNGLHCANSQERNCSNDSVPRSVVENSIHNNENTVETANITGVINNESKCNCKVKFKAYKSNNSKSGVKKIIKKKDPVEFNIANALQLLKMKQKLIVKSQMIKKSIKKKRLLSGNELDSDRPMRKHGKNYENRKKKVTRMKRIILNEREIRMQLMNESKLKLLKFNKLIFSDNLDGCDHFYNHLKIKSIADTNCNHDNCEFSANNIKTILTNANENVQSDEIDPKVLIHSRKFRYYCDQWPNKDMNDNVSNLIKSIVRFQDRSYNCDPIKAQAKRRYVCGFNQVLKFLNVANKAKLVIIATDIECNFNEGSLVDCISQAVKLCQVSAIPYVFCGSRWFLKSCLKKKSPISCVAILNYDGSEELYKNIIHLLPSVKSLYNDRLRAAEIKFGITRQQVEEDETTKCIRSMLNSLTMSNNGNTAVNDLRYSGHGENKEEESGSGTFLAALLKCTKDNL